MKEKRKPLSDVSQIVLPSIKNEVKTDEKETKDVDKSADSSNVYSPMSIDNDKSIQSTCHSLTANRLSCDVDTYTCELYFYLRDVEVMEDVLFSFYRYYYLSNFFLIYRNYIVLNLDT